MIDEETGLYTSESFEELLREQVDGAVREERPYSVVVCLPQQLPGERLSDVAKIAADCVCGLLRESDIAGRLDADVLAICAPDTDAGGARVLAHRLKSDLALRTAHLRTTIWQAGFASLPEDGETAEELLAAAIESAKRSRRFAA